MKELKSINVLSWAKHSAVFLGMLNLLAGIYLTLIYPLVAGVAGYTTSQTLLAIGNNLVLGVVVGFLFFGLLGGALYNLFAAIFGGIKIDLE